MSPLTRLQRAELTAITVRDAEAGEFWFVAPQGSFTAAAAKDRRFLLELVHALQLELADYPQLPDAAVVCGCGGFRMHDGRVLHRPECAVRP